jgi:hypothetical protein
MVPILFIYLKKQQFADGNSAIVKIPNLPPSEGFSAMKWALERQYKP